MKKKKLTSMDILDGTVSSSAALSRNEMKTIIAGSGDGCGGCNPGFVCCHCSGTGHCVLADPGCCGYGFCFPC